MPATTATRPAETFARLYVGKKIRWMRDGVIYAGEIISVGSYKPDCIISVDSDDFGTFFVHEGDIVERGALQTRTQIRRARLAAH